MLQVSQDDSTNGFLSFCSRIGQMIDICSGLEHMSEERTSSLQTHQTEFVMTSPQKQDGKSAYVHSEVIGSKQGVATNHEANQRSRAY
jgi:hypothetical protein